MAASRPDKSIRAQQPAKLVDVLPLGTSVWLEDGEGVRATISAILLRGNGGGDGGFSVQYEAVWWSANVRCCQWLHDHEFRLAETPEMLKIGFGRAEK